MQQDIISVYMYNAEFKLVILYDNLQLQLQFAHLPNLYGIVSQKAPESISERLKFKHLLGGHAPGPI